MSRIIVQAPVVSNQAWGLDAALRPGLPVPSSKPARREPAREEIIPHISAARGGFGLAKPRRSGEVEVREIWQQTAESRLWGGAFWRWSRA